MAEGKERGPNSEVERIVRRAFAHSTQDSQRRFGCLSEDEVAGYVDGRLVANDRARVEKHLAACAECASEVSLLVRLAAEPLPEVPASLVPRAAELVRPRAPRRSQVLRWALAGAAAVSIAIFGNMWLHPGFEDHSPFITQPAHEGPAPAAGTQPPDNISRGFVPPSATPDLITPAEGTSVSAGSTVVSWHPVPGATVYHVNITTVDGDKVAVTSTLKTSVMLPPTIRILRGYRYYLWVTADLDSGKIVGSRPLLFTGL